MSEANQWVAPEDKWPKQGSSASGNDTGYYVEARYPCSAPKTINGQIFDTRWKRIEVADSLSFGVPRAAAFQTGVHLCRLFDYAAAQALRWWFHAQAGADTCFSCVETRIVKCKITYSYSYEAVGAHAVIGAEDRSSMMPDWGSGAKADV